MRLPHVLPFLFSGRLFWDWLAIVRAGWLNLENKKGFKDGIETGKSRTARSADDNGS